MFLGCAPLEYFQVNQHCIWDELVLEFETAKATKCYKIMLHRCCCSDKTGMSVMSLVLVGIYGDECLGAVVATPPVTSVPPASLIPIRP